MDEIPALAACVWLPQGSPLHVALAFDCAKAVELFLEKSDEATLHKLEGQRNISLLSVVGLRTGHYQSTFTGNDTRSRGLAHRYLELLLLSAGVNPNEPSGLDSGWSSSTIKTTASSEATAVAATDFPWGLSETPLHLLLEVAEDLSAEYDDGGGTGELEELDMAIDLLAARSCRSACFLMRAYATASPYVEEVAVRRLMRLKEFVKTVDLSAVAVIGLGNSQEENLDSRNNANSRTGAASHFPQVSAGTFKYVGNKQNWVFETQRAIPSPIVQVRIRCRLPFCAILQPSTGCHHSKYLLRRSARRLALICRCIAQDFNSVNQQSEEQNEAITHNFDTYTHDPQA